MIGVSLLSTPEFDAQPSTLADWLELAAFYSSNRSALLTEMIDQQDLDRDYEPEDFGDLDEQLEDIVSKVSAEIDCRQHDLNDSYPFSLSQDGRELLLVEPWTVGQATYLLCLVLSHSPQSELVPRESAPSDDQLREARDLFQICSTLAAAGKTHGPAYSVGWPRVDGSRLLEKLQEIWAVYGDGTLHETPPRGISLHHKDEGIDVISYWPERDHRPGIGFLIGQVASGSDWEHKSIRPALERFKSWFKDPGPDLY